MLVVALASFLTLTSCLTVALPPVCGAVLSGTEAAVLAVLSPDVDSADSVDADVGSGVAVGVGVGVGVFVGLGVTVCAGMTAGIAVGVGVGVGVTVFVGAGVGVFVGAGVGVFVAAEAAETDDDAAEDAVPAGLLFPHPGTSRAVRRDAVRITERILFFLIIFMLLVLPFKTGKLLPF